MLKNKNQGSKIDYSEIISTLLNANSRLEADNLKLKADNSKLKADNSKLDSALSEFNKGAIRERFEKAYREDQSFTISVNNHIQFNTKNIEILKTDIQNYLKAMMVSLKSYKYVDKETTNAIKFIKIFSGEEVKNKIDWTGGKNHLCYFIGKLYKEKLEKVQGGSKWKVASRCFGVVDVKEDLFSDVIRKACKINNTNGDKSNKTIAAIDKERLNTCINHLKFIKKK